MNTTLQIKNNEKLKQLYDECVSELKSIGINLEKEEVGKIIIQISKRNNKRYGCCKQEKPDERYKRIVKKGFKQIIYYEKFNQHIIEISPWLMELKEEIIKNTIIHEIIHCIPYCNNHQKEFKKYSKYINKQLGYNITTTGDKKKDFEVSNKEYQLNEIYKYKIECKKCGQVFYRQRYNKNWINKYRCGICGGGLKYTSLLLK